MRTLEQKQTQAWGLIRLYTTVPLAFNWLVLLLLVPRPGWLLLGAWSLACATGTMALQNRLRDRAWRLLDEEEEEIQQLLAKGNVPDEA